jgi:hypothetical protein
MRDTTSLPFCFSHSSFVSCGGADIGAIISTYTGTYIIDTYISADSTRPSLDQV